MKLDAIVYTSRTGHTEQYAQILSRKLGVPTYSIKEAVSQLAQNSKVIYLGWIHASHIKCFAKAAKHFHICVVCGVGLCDSGTMIDKVRKASAVPNHIPLFTLQGGIEKSKLKGMNKLLIAMLIKGLSDQKQRSAQDERILQLLTKDGNYVNDKNLRDVLDCCKM